MNNFEELQNQWKKQLGNETSDKEFDILLKGIKGIEKKQKITNVVLTTTILVLVTYVIYVAAFNNTRFMIGVSMMIMSLVIRVVIEIVSLKKLESLNFIENQTSFKETLLGYYKQRKLVHYFFTPIIFLSYIIGFIILLPLFKENLSHGFYIYIVCSSIVIFLFFVFFIAKQVKLELLKLWALQT